MDKCNSCSKGTKSCTCKKKPAPCSTSCSIKTSTDCVIYDANPHRSNLTCFLGVNNGTSLTKILEILDKKLCIPISKCARERLGLGFETDIPMAVVKLLDYVCEIEDVKIKVSDEDNSNGYLFDKIETGDCVKKFLTKDYLGNEKVKIELDFPCIESMLSCCGGNNTSITIQGTNTVCGNNSTLLTAVSNCSTPIVWSNGLTGPTIQATAGIYYATCGGRQSNTITVTSTGNCGCEPIWRDATPLAIYCGQVLGNDNCKKYIKQSNQCNNDIRWVEYTGSGSDGSGCPGCAPTTFIATRSQTFVRQSCPTGCTSGSVTFSKNYYSTVSQAVVDTLATNDNNFLTEGQNYANQNGTCINCPVAPTVAPPPPPSGGNPPSGGGTPPSAPVPSTPLPSTPPSAPPTAPAPTACVEPTSITVNGNLNPIINTTQTYTSTKVGGSSNNIYSWTVAGGTIIGSNTGTTVTVLWGNNTTDLSGINLGVGCVGGSNPKLSINTFTLTNGSPTAPSPVAPSPVTAPTTSPTAPECVLPTSITISGPDSVEANTVATYSYEITGGNNYTSPSWTVIGGTPGVTTGNSISVTWGPNTGPTEASISYFVYCGTSPKFGLKTVEITGSSTPVAPPVEPPTAPPVVRYYELFGCSDSQYGFTTIVPDGLNQRFIIPTNPSVYYTYTGASSEQSSQPSGYNGSFQKTSEYNCEQYSPTEPPTAEPPVTTPVSSPVATPVATPVAPPVAEPTVTYYELQGCLASDYVYTTINPSGGTGQRYVLPSATPTYYRYTGVSNNFTSEPSGYNGSIQIVAGQTDCP